MNEFIKTHYRGLILSVSLGLFAHFLGPYVPGVNGVILAFLIAIIIGNTITLPASFKPGVKFSGSKILEYAIIFLAFSINFQSIAALGWYKFLFVVILIVLSLSATIFIAKKMKTTGSTAWLVGFGTAICGSSAIAAVAPSIAKNKEDAGIAIATVNLLGSVGMIALPFALNFILNDPLDIGFVLGATLQSVGNVAGAGYGLGAEIGDTALTVKLARVALLTPAVLIFSFVINRNESKEQGDKIGFKLPYYLWLFIGISIFVSVIDLPKDILAIAKLIGDILLTISMAAIGLSVSFKKLWQSGKMAIGFGAIIFLIQIVASLALILIF